MIKDGFYKRLSMKVEELAKDQYMQDLEASVIDFYDDYIYNRNGWHVDSDTSCETWVGGSMENGTFYCTVMSVTFEFVDEMNDVVSQTIVVNFNTGEVSISDDDYGCIYRDTVPGYMLYCE